jgi:hypothetical protein
LAVIRAAEIAALADAFSADVQAAVLVCLSQFQISPSQSDDESRSKAIDRNSQQQEAYEILS